MSGSSVEKARYFVFLVYPESAPDHWVDILKRSHGQFAISPLHTPDDECAKPHHHVIYRHGNSVSRQGALAAIPDEVPANGYVETCSSPKGYMRYLVHLDDPDKQQWDDPRGSIEVLNGFPLDLSREYSREELGWLRRRIFEFIREFDVVEYSELLDGLQEGIGLAAEDDAEAMFDYVANHTLLFSKYLDSKRLRDLVR